LIAWYTHGDASQPYRRFLAIIVLKFVAAILIFLAIVIAWLAFGIFRRTLFARSVERAGRQFAANRESYRAVFLAAAAASGKPRGLTWKETKLDDRLILARDRANGELIGLVGVTISFEAVKGGAMEDVEAVGNLRAATAIFSYNGHDWTTQGRTVFNLEPHEVLERHRESLDPIGQGRSQTGS